MPGFGPTELLIILVIVLLLFGVGRVSKIGSELGSAVSNFRKGVEDAKKSDEIVAPDLTRDLGTRQGERL